MHALAYRSETGLNILAATATYCRHYPSLRPPTSRSCFKVQSRVTPSQAVVCALVIDYSASLSKSELASRGGRQLTLTVDLLFVPTTIMYGVSWSRVGVLRPEQHCHAREKWEFLVKGLLPRLWLSPHPDCLAGVAGVPSPLGVCSGQHSPTMTVRKPTGTTDGAQRKQRAVSRFWQNCDRYHDLAKNFAQDIAIVHPNDISGRHPSCPGDTECCGYCRTNYKYYEHIPKSHQRF